MTDRTGQQLGERSYIPWADWARGLACSLRVWRDIFSQLDTIELVAATGRIRGVQARRAEIDAAILTGWRVPPVTRQRLPGDERWPGQFTPRGIVLLVASQISNSSIQFFSIRDGSRLHSDGALIDPLLSWQRICVGLHGKE